jgi:hypothetical protein
MSIVLPLLLCALSQAPAKPPSPVAEAQRLIGAGDVAGAAALLAPYLEQVPTDAQAWVLLGFARHSAGELDAALVAHRRAAEFPATAAVGNYNAACALALLGRAEEAWGRLDAAVGAGFGDRAQAFEDPDLENLRGDPDFASHLPALRLRAAAFREPVTVIHELHGETAGEEFGWVARAVGDQDGDGVSEFAVTAPSAAAGPAAPFAGRVQVFSGATGQERFRRQGTVGERFGNTVAPAGEVDGDGVPDLVVGAPGTSPNRAGRAYVLSGADGALLLTLEGTEGGDQFGMKLCGVGDLDGDGRAELAVGAPRSSGAAGVQAGVVTVHSGADGSVLRRLEGERAGDQFGSSVVAEVGAPTLLAIGAQNAGEGQRGTVGLYTLTRDGLERRFLLAASPTGQNFGQYFLSFPGDLDGDGVVDLYASDFTDTKGGPHNGRVVVASGADGRPLLEQFGRRPGEGFGTSPADAGDLDGDGRGDLCVGAWQNSDGGRAAGRVYLISGATGRELATLTGTEPGDTLGFDAVGLGDVNGDGVRDLLLTSAWSAVHGSRTGRVFVVSGPALASSSPEAAR